MPPDTDSLTLKTARLSLKPFSLRDADEAFSCISPSMTRFMTWDPPASRQEFDGIWSEWLTGAADGTEFVFAVRHRTTDQFLGLAGLHRLRSDSPELGIWIREDKQGMAFGREAVQAVLEWASTVSQAPGFCYPVAEENVASRKIAESLGGQVVGHQSTPKYESVTYQIPRVDADRHVD